MKPPKSSPPSQPLAAESPLAPWALPPDLSCGANDELGCSRQTAMPEANPLQDPSSQYPDLPGFAIERKLGQGGMGAVYLARDLTLGRQVAIKVIPAGGSDAEKLRDRFAIEIQALATLQHTHIARLYSVTQIGPTPFLVMEYVDGPTLEQRATKLFPIPQLTSLMLKLCDALEYCHERGILHRDLKPSNVLMTSDDEPKIADFGLAKLSSDESAHTQTGEILGTPSYMAPEQASGVVKSLTPACDVYGLGAILYRLLTGRPPFVGADPLQTLLAVLSDEPLSPRQLVPGIPRDLETICWKCLEKNPLRRYGTVSALTEDLRRFSEGRPILARPTSRLGRCWKWVRRNPTWAWGYLSAGLLIAASVGGLSWHNAKLARELARTQRLARHGSDLSQWVLADLADELYQLPGASLTRMETIQRVKEFLNDSFQDVPADPVFTRRLGYSFAQLATAAIETDYRDRDVLQQAEQDYLRALELYEQAARSDTVDPELEVLQASVYRRLANLYWEWERPQEHAHYRELARQAIARLSGSDWRTQLLRILMANAEVESALARNDVDSALRHLEQVDTLLAEAGPDAVASELIHQKILVGVQRAAAAEIAGDLAQAAEHLQAQLVTSTKTLNAQPENVRFQLRHSTLLAQVGDLHATQDQLPESLDCYQQASAIMAKLARQDPQSLEFQVNWAQKLSRVSIAQRYMNQLDDAAKTLDQGLEILHRLAATGKGGLSLKRNLSVLILAQAELCMARSQPSQAERLFSEHEQLNLELLQKIPEGTHEWRMLAENYFAQAVPLINQLVAESDVTPFDPRSHLCQRISLLLANSLDNFAKIERLRPLNFHEANYRRSVESVQNKYQEILTILAQSATDGEQ